ncbi:MAG: hypothetical protein ABIR79_16045 [Candidatus Binatia bacterium]
MLLQQIALVSQSKAITLAQLNVASAALQKQVARDLRPIWQLNATVDAFASLDDVPLGYWPIVMMDKIPFPAQGIHLNKKNGDPFALVEVSNNWTLTTSHECLEMLVDPSGNRTVASNSVKPGQGRVSYLVEVCDPSEAAKFAYTVNGVLLSDFYTPEFFDPVPSNGVRYSFVGAITQPREVLDGGYLSWFDPASGHAFQIFVAGSKKTFKDLGAVPEGFGAAGTLRSFTDNNKNAATHRLKALAGNMPKGLLLTAAVSTQGAAGMKALMAGQRAIGDELEGNASLLQAQIDELVGA